MAENSDETALIAIRHPTGPTRPVADVRAIRKKLELSQSRFARSFGVSLATVQDWEQGRSRPDQTARAFLRVIEARPDVVRDVIDHARSAS